MKYDIQIDFSPSQTLEFRDKIKVSLVGEWELNRLGHEQDGSGAHIEGIGYAIFRSNVSLR
jgi:hypothetical protein